jgi:Spy/CpxP family protein refolding chaperone
MRGNSLKIALVLSLAFNAAVMGAVVYGFARKPAPGPWRGRAEGGDLAAGRCSMLCRQMGIAPERRLLFTRAMADCSEGMSETRRQLVGARRQLADLLRAPEPDKMAIMAKVDTISVLQGQLEKSLIERLLKASSVLTPEERARLMRFVGYRGVPRGRAGERGPMVGGPGPEAVPR